MVTKTKPWILLIEDEKHDQDKILEALNPEDNPKYDIDISDTWTDAETKLRSRRYDLVVVDIYIYKDEEEKKNEVRGNYSCLRGVLECSESIYPPIPVIVYTGREKLESLEADHHRISDFWEKPLQLKPKFYEFRVRKVLELLERQHPSPLLMRRILENLTDQAPWAEEVAELIGKYESYELDTDRADVVYAPLSKIASGLYCSKTFWTGFEALKKIDTSSSVLLSGVRPHVLHSLKTFLLGYFLFNLSGIRWRDILANNCRVFRDWVRTAGVVETEAVEKAWKDINAAWFTAALLHDVGLVMQYYAPMTEELARCINSLELTRKIKAQKAPALVDLELACTRMSGAGTDEKVVGFLKQKTKEKEVEGKINHGIASAIFLAKNCYDEINTTLQDEGEDTGAARFIAVASEAVALHNLTDDVQFPKLDFSKNPISCMLAFCDSIQAWDRQHIDFGLLNEGRIAKVELCELDCETGVAGGSIISATLKYIPHSMVLLSPPTRDKTTKSLQKTLQDHVKNPLSQKIRFTGSTSLIPKFKIDFKVGQETIDSLILPAKKD
ncbi:MAG: hypothetical protein ACETWQ_11975 [Phycisphaerae bacterium]